MATTTRAPATQKAGTGKTTKTKTATSRTVAKSATTKTTAAKRTAQPALKESTATTKARSSATKPTAPRKAPARKTHPVPRPTPEQHYCMVQEAAYYLAEKNGFSGSSQEYWIAAEAEIERLLSGQ